MASPTKSSIELNTNSTEIQHEEVKVEEENEINNELSKYDDVIATLPCVTMPPGRDFFKYGNFWYTSFHLSSTMAIHETFKLLPLDQFVATFPKSGTTWIKALVFAVVNRTRFAFDQHHPLLLSNPHDCVPFIEHVYHKKKLAEINSHDPASPRLFGMHIPYSALPLSIKNSNCRIIYLCREPKDTFVSFYHFVSKLYSSLTVPLNEIFEMFCKGYSANGPIWDHILEYWKESLSRPEKIMFLKYEELRAEPIENVIRLSEFVGNPFTEEEVKAGVVEEIIKLCSFENLSEIEVNRNGIHRGIMTYKNSAFFRKGKVGDWKEHLSPEMAKKLDDIIEQKFEGSGLTFH